MSILGSLLFILRQGDLPENWEESNFQQTALALESPPDEAMVMYVDDATEIVSDNDIINLLTITQKRVDWASDWLLDNGTVVAPQKSRFLLSCSRELRNS